MSHLIKQTLEYSDGTSQVLDYTLVSPENLSAHELDMDEEVSVEEVEVAPEAPVEAVEAPVEEEVAPVEESPEKEPEAA